MDGAPIFLRAGFSPEDPGDPQRTASDPGTVSMSAPAPHAGLPRLPGQQNQFPQGKSIFTLADSRANTPQGGTLAVARSGPHGKVDTAAANQLAQQRQQASPELSGPLGGMFNPVRQSTGMMPKVVSAQLLAGFRAPQSSPVDILGKLAQLYHSKTADDPGTAVAQAGAGQDPLASYGGNFGGADAIRARSLPAAKVYAQPNPNTGPRLYILSHTPLPGTVLAPTLFSGKYFRRPPGPDARTLIGQERSAQAPTLQQAPMPSPRREVGRRHGYQCSVACC